MACYTVHLVSGQTLLCKTIKSGTVKRYLAAAAELSIPAKMMNPTLDIMGNQSAYIKNIIKECQRWESMPDRKEPVTKEMVEYIIEKGKSLSQDNPDNLYSALGDWLVLGEQAGFRRKEWAQDRTYLRKHKDVERNIDGSPAAFTITDLEFRGSQNKRINNKLLKEITKACIVNLKWRFQKNRDNGQVISYLRDLICKTHCAVQAAKNIHKRAIRLKVHKDKSIEIKKIHVTLMIFISKLCSEKQPAKFIILLARKIYLYLLHIQSG